MAFNQHRNQLLRNLGRGGGLVALGAIAYGINASLYNGIFYAQIFF